MSLLQVDVAQARKILSKRIPEPKEIQILMLFKTPLDNDILMGEEFEDILADGSIEKSHVQKIINRLISEKILLPIKSNTNSKNTKFIRADFSNKTSSLSRLIQSISGDLISMADWAEQNVDMDGLSPSEYLNSIREQLSKFHNYLRESKDNFVREQLNELDKSPFDMENIHLGCGDSCPEGWTNIDMIGGDMRLNLCWNLPFDDHSVQYVYSAHTLEHLDYHTSAPRLIREIFRILKPGGILRLAVPDLGAYTEAYVKNNSEFFKQFDRARPEFGFDAGYRTPMTKVMMMAGSSSKTGMLFEHKMGYDFNTLSELFILAGFNKCKQSKFEMSSHKLLREIDSHSIVTGHEFATIENSLFVEGTK